MGKTWACTERAPANILGDKQAVGGSSLHTNTCGAKTEEFLVVNMADQNLSSNKLTECDMRLWSTSVRSLALIQMPA